MYLKWIHFPNWITSQFLSWNCWKSLQNSLKSLAEKSNMSICPILSHLQLLSILPSLWDRNISRSCRGDAMANPYSFTPKSFLKVLLSFDKNMKFWKQASDIAGLLKFKGYTLAIARHLIFKVHWKPSMPMAAVFEASAKEQPGIKEQCQNISIPRHTHTQRNMLQSFNVPIPKKWIEIMSTACIDWYVLNLHVKTHDSHVHKVFMW